MVCARRGIPAFHWGGSYEVGSLVRSRDHYLSKQKTHYCKSDPFGFVRLKDSVVLNGRLNHLVERRGPLIVYLPNNSCEFPDSAYRPRGTTDLQIIILSTKALQTLYNWEAQMSLFHY